MLIKQGKIAPQEIDKLAGIYASCIRKRDPKRRAIADLFMAGSRMDALEFRAGVAARLNAQKRREAIVREFMDEAKRQENLHIMHFKKQRAALLMQTARDHHIQYIPPNELHVDVDRGVGAFYLDKKEEDIAKNVEAMAKDGLIHLFNSLNGAITRIRRRAASVAGVEALLEK